jgi:hypothetical protein
VVGLAVGELVGEDHHVDLLLAAVHPRDAETAGMPLTVVRCIDCGAAASARPRCAWNCCADVSLQVAVVRRRRQLRAPASPLIDTARVPLTM